MNKIIAYKGISDAELVGRLRDGEEHAFNETYNRHKDILLALAYKKLVDYNEAKDVIQDTFSWIWNNRETLKDISNVSGYLYGIVRNKVLNVIAHKKVVFKHQESFGNFIDKGISITDHLVREKELVSKIEQEVNALPEKTRAVFMMTRQDNLSYKEISAQLGITENTVKYHIKNALKTLREKLDLIN